MDDDDGHVRFYGPTSQPYISSRGVLEAREPPPGPHRQDAVITIGSAAVRNRLLQKFWSTQQLSQALVDQAAFETGRKTNVRSQYYSHFLESAILAIASRMSTSGDIRALGPAFADQATAEIVGELANPNIASIQGFLTLSDYEATRGRQRVGYLYCGIGCRMVFDFGLQESCNDLMTAARISPPEALARHILFLGAYVYSKLWSLYLGRPSSMLDSLLLKSQQQTAEQGWTVPSTLDAWVGLCTDISEVNNIVNNGSDIESVSLDRLHDLDAKIKRRCDRLPSSLALDEAHISDLAVNGYGLHIQFRGVRIILHRLLSEAAVKQGLSSRGTLDSLIARSKAIMYENAVCITRLAFVYQQLFGIESMITIMLDNMFVAATVLVAHVNQMQHKSGASYSLEQDTQWLRHLADMLDGAEKHYPVTARMRRTLSNAVDGTLLAGMFGQLPQRQSAQVQTAEPSGSGTIDWMDQHAHQQPAPGNDASLEHIFGENFQDFSQNPDTMDWTSWTFGPTV